MTREQARSLLLALNPMVPALAGPGQDDWRFSHRLCDDVAEFGWKNCEDSPEVYRLVTRLMEYDLAR